jgi:hypothetical protein
MLFSIFDELFKEHAVEDVEKAVADYAAGFAPLHHVDDIAGYIDDRRKARSDAKMSCSE